MQWKGQLIKAVAIDKQKGELEHRLDEITHRKGELMRDQEEVKAKEEAEDLALQEAAEQAKRDTEDSANREAESQAKEKQADSVCYALFVFKLIASNWIYSRRRWISAALQVWQSF
jgi:hypothetical protein